MNTSHCWLQRKHFLRSWQREKKREVEICIKHIIGDESLAYLSTLSIVSHLYQQFYNIHTSCHFHCAPDEFDAWCLIAGHSSWCCCLYCCCCCLCLHRSTDHFRICEALQRWRRSVDCRSSAKTSSWTVMLQFPAVESVVRLTKSFVDVF